MRKLVGITVSTLVVALFACGTPDPNAREKGKFPDEAQFIPNPDAGRNAASVADFLVHRCGSLDCHGQAGRNLKIYGSEGLRLAAGDTPGGNPTTAMEYDADYRSVCGLEPEILTEVVADGGKNPERLSLVQKPRNTQDHKGGQIIKIGDVQDKCMLSWLSGATDTDSCAQALMLP